MLKLCEDRLVLISSGKEKFQHFEGDAVVWDKIKEERFILREEGSGTRELFINALKQRDIDIKDIDVVASIENPDTIKQCVREGLGVAVVSERSVQQEMDLGLLKGYYISDLDLRRSFYFIGHKNRVLSPVARAFRDFTAKYCQGL
jgi:DNA-binding transcriptional LysR family regulator